MRSFLDRNGKWLIAIALIVLIAYFVWPTPWIIRDDGESRLNRITGRIQYSGNDGWHYPQDAPIEVNEETPFAHDRLVFSDIKFGGEFKGMYTKMEFVLENPTSQRLYDSYQIVFYDKNDVEIGSHDTFFELDPGGKKQESFFLMPSIDVERYDHFKVKPDLGSLGE